MSLTQQDRTNFISSTAELVDAICIPVLEAMTGYRNQCEALGFSPTAAEQMAVSMHTLMLHVMMTVPNNDKVDNDG